MNHKPLLIGASAVAIAISCCAPGGAQGAVQAPVGARQKSPAELKREQAEPEKATKSAREKAAAESEADGAGEVVVTGVRSSLAKARETKRNSDNIVDVVEAEDIGKLPNNTVGDVIATLPGIDAFRREGEVDEIRLRGLDGVQTTIGGTPIEAGSGRSASIADLPADLVKSIDVSKTRTPDQVEGAGAGSVNIEMRKPNDFKYGFFATVSTQQRYNNQSRKMVQIYTGIANYRRSTGIGDIGITLGATLNTNPFLDSRAFNDNPLAVDSRQVVGPQILPYPTYAPRQVMTGYYTGKRSTPSYTGALQWSNGENSIALEGNYSVPSFRRINNEMYLPILTSGLGGNANALPALSNIVLIPGTNRMASVSVTPTSPIQAIATASKSRETQYVYKLTAVHTEPLYRASTEIALYGSNRDEQRYTFRNRFVTRPTYDVTFANDDFGFPQMNTVIKGIDMLDPAEYRFYEIAETLNKASNQTLALRSDLRLNINTILRTLDVGVRFTRGLRKTRSFTRTASGNQIPLADLPGSFGDLIPLDQGFAGTGVKNAWQWLGYDIDKVIADYDELREYLAPRFPLFATEDAPLQQSSVQRRDERSFAVYGNAKFRAKLLIPIDLNIGARLSNWFEEARSFRTRGSGATLTYEPILRKSNRLNFEPTITTRFNFTKNFRAGLSYNYSIKRPSFNDLNPYISFNTSAFTATSGNPDLQPEKIVKFDGTLEWYFNKNGLITINPFYWKRDGAVTRFRTLEEFDGIYYNVERPYNSGKGYKRGVEAQAQTFFFFLPGILKNFGANLNYTYTETELEYLAVPGATTTAPIKLPELSVPKHLFNAALLFEKGTFNAKISYTYVGSVLDNRAPSDSPAYFASYFIPRDRWLEAAVNYTIPSGPLKNLRISLQAQNILGQARRTFYGFYDTPRDVWYNPRVYGGTLAYKF